MIRFFANGMFLLCFTLTTACTSISNYNKQGDFDKNVKAYNRMLRWHEIANAGMLYMEPEGRDVFLKTAEDIRKRSVTIADYRILTTECLPEKGTGDVVVEFDYFIMPSNRLKTLTYRQKWQYFESDEKKGWKVKSSLPLFE